MSKIEKSVPLIVDQETVREALPHLDVRDALTQMFRSLGQRRRGAAAANADAVLQAARATSLRTSA